MANEVMNVVQETEITRPGFESEKGFALLRRLNFFRHPACRVRTAFAGIPCQRLSQKTAAFFATAFVIKCVIYLHHFYFPDSICMPRVSAFPEATRISG